MEALAAVSLAGNIVEFVKFSTDLLTGTVEILRSPNGGQSRISESQDLARLVQQRIQDFVQQLDQNAGATRLDGSGNRPLRSLCDSCCAVAEKLLSLLDPLTAKADYEALRTRKALSRAIKAEWKKDQIQDLETRLHQISQQLNVHVRDSQINKIAEQLSHIDRKNTQHESTRTEEIRQLRRDLQRISEKSKRGTCRGKETWTSLTEVCISCASLSTEQKILRELAFQRMDDRHVRIASAHAETFEWVFTSASSQDADLPRINFTDWLCAADEPIYWISGKPGSGKSTLMKYLFHHDKTRETLKRWARDCELDTIGYFFWAAAGDSLQKSQEGLLRSILYHILRKRPDQIRLAFPEVWAQHEERSKGCSADLNFERTVATSVDEVTRLLDALSRITSSVNRSKHKICFFIDGLDEYEGRPKEIIGLLDLMKTSVNLKFYLASRSWSEFEEAYGAKNPWKLYIHEVTKGDIAQYIRDKFELDERFQRLRHNDERCPDLVQNLVDNASGVFLWVVLVVNSLLDGLTNGDRITDLQRRLLDLPTELDELFESILDGIDPFYRERSAQILTVADAAVVDLPLMTHWYIDQSYPCDSNKVDYPTSDVVDFRLKQMNQRLKALSKGLLEAPEPLDRSCDPTGYQNFLSLEVSFLHRTVVDYLRLPASRAKIRSWTTEKSETNLTICKGVLAHLLARPVDPLLIRDQDLIASLLSTFHTHAFYIHDETCDPHEEMRCLDGMQSLLHSMDRSEAFAKEISLHMFGPISPTYLAEFIPLHMMPLYFGLTRYLRSMVRRHFLQSEGSTFGTFILWNCRPLPLMKLAPKQLASAHQEILQILLEAGYSPDSKMRNVTSEWANETIWTLYLAAALGRSNGCAWDGPHFPVVQKMLEYGASLNMVVDSKKRPKSVQSAVKAILTAEEFEKVKHYWDSQPLRKTWPKKPKIRFWKN